MVLVWGGRRFMYEPRDEIENGLEAKIKASSDEITALEKKAKHYQNEMATAQGSLRDLLQQERKLPAPSLLTSHPPSHADPRHPTPRLVTLPVRNPRLYIPPSSSP